MSLGVTIFLIFFGMAFWLLLFLMGFAGLWAHWGLLSIVKANLAKRGAVKLEENEISNVTTEVRELTVKKKKKEKPLSRKQTHIISSLKKHNEYYAFGLSVQGKSHKKTDNPIPCQDNHSFDSVNERIHIAIVSDGAGSAENSHFGSQLATKKLLEFTIEHIKENKWVEHKKLLSNKDWYKQSIALFKKTRTELKLHSKEKNIPFESLKCTLILVINTPHGFLSAQIGDGRAGFKLKEEYKSLVVPFQTFVVGATMFLTKDNWNQFFRTDAIEVTDPDAFFVISDGCDDFSFAQKGPVDKNESGVYDMVYNEARYDHNKPFPGFYNSFIGNMKELVNSGDTEKITKVAEEIIDKGIYRGSPVDGIIKEDDDKTIVLFFK